MTTPVLPDNRILRCAVVDDEPLALSLMVSYVEKTPFLSLSGAYSSAVEALGALAAMQVDLVFLDIQMPELDGLDFSRMIDKSVKIVFTTAFDRYASTDTRSMLLIICSNRFRTRIFLKPPAGCWSVFRPLPPRCAVRFS